MNTDVSGTIRNPRRLGIPNSRWQADRGSDMFDITVGRHPWFESLLMMMIIRIKKNCYQISCYLPDEKN